MRTPIVFFALVLAQLARGRRTNVKFGPLDPNITDPADFWMPLWNDLPQDYCTHPRYPIVPTPGPIAVDVLHAVYPNGTVPQVPAKPTNTWQKNLWGFDWSDENFSQDWSAVYAYPYAVMPKAGMFTVMYPGAPSNGTQNRAMITGFAFPDPPPAMPNLTDRNASYPYLTMAGSFDFTVQITNGQNPKLKELGDMSATIEYRDPSQGNRTVATVYLVKGSPFVNIVCDGAQIQFGSTISPPVIGVNNEPPGQVITDTQFSMEVAEGPLHHQAKTWHAFFQHPVGLDVPNPPNRPLNVTAPYTGLLQLAVGTMDDQAADFLKKAAGTYTTGAKVEYDVGETNATIRFRWNVKGNGTLAMLALPHHLTHLDKKSTVVHPSPFWCIKGNMSAVHGDVWNMTYNITNVGFGDKLSVDAEMKGAVLKAAKNDYELRIAGCPGDNDTQGFPGYMNMELYAYVRDLAQCTDIAIILENLGERDMAVNMTMKVLRCMAPILKRPEKAPEPCPAPINNTAVCVRDMMNIYFDTQWGGLITGWFDRFAPHYCQCDKPGGPYACRGFNYCDNPRGFDAFANYGNAFYNDHHFQYGYILKNLGWAVYFQETKGAPLGMNATVLRNITKQALAFARDIGNPDPAKDKYFAFLRHKDVFDGHSWAEGYDYSGRVVGWINQQSGGEAINGYYGIYLLGLALNDTNVMDWGRIHLATEASSISHYQHLSNRTASGKKDMPDKIEDQWGKCMPILFGNGNSGATYYGPNPLFQCGITFLPVTPFTREWINASWAQEAVEWIQWHNNRTGNCVFFDPVTMSTNPCPGQFGPDWTGNEWGCCPTNEGYVNNQWVAWPNWFPYLYALVSQYDAKAAWKVLDVPSYTKGTRDLPFPYQDSKGKVVGYQSDMTMTSIMFHVATHKRV